MVSTLLDAFMSELVDREYERAMAIAENRIMNLAVYGQLMQVTKTEVSTSPHSSPAFTVQFISAKDMFK